MIVIILLAILVLAFACNHKTAAPDEQAQATTTQEQTTTQEKTTEATQAQTTTTQPPVADYTFRSNKLLKDHYYKHGVEMGFDSAEAYEAAANAVIANPEALTKTEQEDGDYVYYVESTNEFVVLSTDGYIRTYFCPDSGKSYFDRQ